MMHYALLVVSDHRILSTPARNRTEARGVFGKQLGYTLIEEGAYTAVAPYLLDEWKDNPHWVNPTIPIFVEPKS